MPPKSKRRGRPPKPAPSKPPSASPPPSLSAPPPPGSTSSTAPSSLPGDILSDFGIDLSAPLPETFTLFTAPISTPPQRTTLDVYYDAHIDLVVRAMATKDPRALKTEMVRNGLLSEEEEEVMEYAVEVIESYYGVKVKAEGEGEEVANGIGKQKEVVNGGMKVDMEIDDDMVKQWVEVVDMRNKNGGVSMKIVNGGDKRQNGFVGRGQQNGEVLNGIHECNIQKPQVKGIHESHAVQKEHVNGTGACQDSSQSSNGVNGTENIQRDVGVAMNGVNRVEMNGEGTREQVNGIHEPHVIQKNGVNGIANGIGASQDSSQVPNGINGMENHPAGNNNSVLVKDLTNGINDVIMADAPPPNTTEPTQPEKRKRGRPRKRPPNPSPENEPTAVPQKHRRRSSHFHRIPIAENDYISNALIRLHDTLSTLKTDESSVPLSLKELLQSDLPVEFYAAMLNAALNDNYAGQIASEPLRFQDPELYGWVKREEQRTWEDITDNNKEDEIDEIKEETAAIRNALEEALKFAEEREGMGVKHWTRYPPKTWPLGWGIPRGFFGDGSGTQAQTKTEETTTGDTATNKVDVKTRLRSSQKPPVGTAHPNHESTPCLNNAAIFDPSTKHKKSAIIGQKKTAGTNRVVEIRGRLRKVQGSGIIYWYDVVYEGEEKTGAVWRREQRIKTDAGKQGEGMIGGFNGLFPPTLDMGVQVEGERFRG